MYIGIDEVTATAQTVVKTADSMDRNIWKSWIYIALLDLGISDDEIKVAELTPKDLLAKLPDGCRQIIDVAVYDASGLELRNKFRAGRSRIHADRRILPAASTSSTTLNSLVPVDISNDENYIHLGTNGSEVATIVVRYFAYPIDQNGQPMVREEDIMACVHFIKYMQAMRDDDNQSKREQFRIDWAREADRARARKKMSSMTPAKTKTLMSSLMKAVTPFTTINDF